MSGASIADLGICSFRDFPVDTSPEHLRKHLGAEPTCLADFIKAWVQSGEGIRACIGDFQVFLITVIAIINDWRTDPGFLDYVTDEDGLMERRPESIFGERDLNHPILDPHFFATWKFRWLHGPQPVQ
jgi:hypothetical protein